MENSVTDSNQLIGELYKIRALTVVPNSKMDWYHVLHLCVWTYEYQFKLGDESTIDNLLGRGVLHWDAEADLKTPKHVSPYLHMYVWTYPGMIFSSDYELFTSCQDAYFILLLGIFSFIVESNIGSPKICLLAFTIVRCHALTYLWSKNSHD